MRATAAPIVNVTSIEGPRAAPGFVVHAACGAGMTSFTRPAALEPAGHGIRANAIAPDVALTEQLVRFVPPLAWAEGQAANARCVPLGRAGDLDDCAGVAVFLSCGPSRYVTDTTISADGGARASSGSTRRDDDWTPTGA